MSFATLTASSASREGTGIRKIMNPLAPFSGNSFQAQAVEIQSGRLQFIQQTFPETLGEIGGGRSRGEWVRWIHDRLFNDGWQVNAVRSELARVQPAAQVIAVTSGKGGVGKTTFAVNLAVAFAQQGKRVLLFDADLGMANVHVFAGVNPTATILDFIDGRATLDSILISGPAGIRIACGASGVGRLADLSERVLESLGRELMRVALGFDVLIIDTGAGVAPSVMHFLAIAHDAVVIATPNLASTLDAYGVVKVVHEQRLRTRLHLLVNEADDETQAAAVTARVTGCANRFLKSTPGDLGFLRRDPAFEASNQQRRPLLLAQPASIPAQRIAQIAARLAAAPVPTANTSAAA